MTAAYLDLSQKELQQRSDQAYEIYRSCRVCPHACDVNRTDGETGFCGQLDTLHISSSVQHFGEDSPLVVSNRVGNFNFENTLFCCTRIIDFCAPKFNDSVPACS